MLTENITAPCNTERDKPPAISIIIPAYDSARYIAAALDSVRAQTFEDYEVIVINDGSRDTPELETALRPYRDQVVYLEQENLGAAVARNSGIAVARGKYLAFLDADDTWMPAYLAEQVAAIQRDGGYDLVYANALLCGDPGVAGRTYMDLAPSEGEVTFESLITARCNVITSGVVALRQPIVEAGSFDPELRRAQDFDLWLRLARRGFRLTYQRSVLLRYNVHAEGLSGDLTKQLERELSIVTRYSHLEDLTDHERVLIDGHIDKLEASLKRERGKALLARSEFLAAAEAFKDANRFFRSVKLSLVILGIRVAPRLLKRVHELRGL